MRPEHKAFFVRWKVAIRPFALPASTMPVVFGSLLAPVLTGTALRWGLFLISLLAMAILHSAANILSDVTDFRLGLDTQPTPVSGAVVRGLLTSKQALGGSAVLFGVGILLGIFLAWRTTPYLLLVGGAGILIGFLYSRGGAFALKYRGLGDAAVFTAFGTLGSLGAWMVQTGRFAWPPVIYSLPLALLVVAILHANNWRDIPSDGAGGIRTVAMVLGDKGSSYYFHLLVMLPFILVVAFIGGPRWTGAAWTPLPFSCLLSLGALFFAIPLLRRARHRHISPDPMDFIALDAATARLNLVFGGLLNLALALELLL